MSASLSLCTLDHGLLLGACPRSPEHVTELVSVHEVDTIVNLQTDGDFESLRLRWSLMWQHMVSKGLDVVRVPIEDFNERSMEAGMDEAVAVVTERLQAGERVYLHCTAGINRSSTVAAAVLAGPYKMGFLGALEHISSRRRVAPYMGLVQRWLERHHPAYADSEA
ncbi:MAG: hypothetical protein CMH54_05765 [Myxococcales bacterium]|nr:hypothetical protein [Myxococcales bacterium]